MNVRAFQQIHFLAANEMLAYRSQRIALSVLIKFCPEEGSK